MLRHLAFLCQNIINIIMKLREGKKQVCIGALSANATIFL